MIVTEGGWCGGYGLYLLKGKPVFTYNLLQLLQPRWAGEQTLAAGKHTIEFDFIYDGPGIAKGGTGVLKVDGQDVHKLTIPQTIPFLMPADETFDIGVDTRTGVNDLDYKVPFPLQRHDRQADLQAWADTVGRGRPQEDAEGDRRGERLNRVHERLPERDHAYEERNE